MMRCVSYTRWTSYMPGEEIKDDTIRQQNDRISKFAKEKGWKIQKKYYERKKDAEAEDAFKELRTDGIKREFDLVIVDSLFRCGRGIPYAEDVLLKVFFPAGIHFAVVEDNLCSMDFSNQELKSYFRKKKYMAVNKKLCNWSQEQQKQGILSVHEERYGYLLNETRTGLVIDPEAEKVINEIFQLMKDGNIYADVAKLMQEKGYESPSDHLMRVGHKNYGFSQSSWTLESVRRIVNCHVYLGGYERKVGNETMFIPTPAIITQDLFDQVQEQIAKRRVERKKEYKRSVNAFQKRIYDSETGKALVCYLKKKPEEYQVFQRDVSDKKRVAYDDVMAAVIGALKREKEIALHILGKSKDEIASELQGKLDELSVQAKKIFQDETTAGMNYIPLFQSYENGEISEEQLNMDQENIRNEIKQKDEQFQKLMERFDDLQVAYSDRNPWLCLYSHIDIPDVLEREHVRQWVSRVTVEDMKYIHVVFLQEHWRQLLPTEWFEEVGYGKKKS